MRKHFLILMLMALLPLAAFADGEKNIGTNAFQFTISASTFGYNGNAVNDPTDNRLGATLQEEGYDDPVPENCYELVFKADGSDTEIAAPSAVGSYTVFARGLVAKGYTGVTATRSFTITKGTIVAGNFTATPAKKDGLVYSGEAQQLITAGTIAAAFGKIYYKLSTDDDSKWSLSVPKGTNAGTYVVNWKVVGSNNYNDFAGDDIADAAIAKKAVDETTLKAVVSGVPTAAVTYNGNEQKITIGGTTGVTAKIQKKVGEEWVDVEGASYNNPVIEYYTDAARDAEHVAAKVKNVGTYYLKIKEPATGVNYSFSKDDATYTIAQQNLLISLGTRNKVYDGSAFTLDAADITFIPGQLAAGDEGAVIAGYAAEDVFAADDDKKFSKNVGTYYAKATVAGITITKGTGIAAEDVTANYSIQAVQKAWTITPRPLTISAEAKDIPNGTKLSTLTDDDEDNGELSFIITKDGAEGVAPETGAVAADVDAIEERYRAIYDVTKIKHDASPEEIAAGILDDDATDILPQTVENGIVLSYVPELAEDEEDNILLKNYTITKNSASVTIKGKAFTIQPAVATVQYGTAITPDYSAFDATLAAATVDVDKLVYEYKHFDAEDIPANWSETKPTEVDKYNVRFKVTEGDSYGTGAYLGGEMNPVASVFSIVKKQIKLQVKNQTVKKNDVAATFLAGLATADATAPTSYEFVDETSTAYGETLTLTYTLDDDKVLVTDGRIISVKEGKTLESAIKADISDADKAKYDVVAWTYGNLEISTVFEADFAAATAATTIAEAAANGSEYNVTISGRTLNADKWNVMVLPFAVKPLDFCKAVDQYAVFNTLKSAENGNVKFGLCYDEIPANQPFLVKTKAAVDFDEIDDHGTPSTTDDTKKYVIKGVTFVQGEPKQENVSGAIFKGTYAATYAIPEDSYYAMQGGVFKHFTTPNNLTFTRAYIVLTDATEARFFVEEADGTVTAISSINADGVAMPAEGWYTLNGVKLQAAPVEKGVYINNGKKVVIK